MLMMLVTVSAIVLAFAPSSLAYNKVGCFVDKPVRILSGKYTSNSSMTVDMCVKICTDQGNFFAAVENAYQCYCGNILQPYERLDDTECSTPCDGNKEQMCGGSWKASVYKTEINFFYMGCYEDKDGRILEGEMKISQEMSPVFCVNHCKVQGKRYALTEHSDQCFCGNHLKTYDKKPDSECNSKCPGDDSKMCGGFFRGSLYLINYNL